MPKESPTGTMWGFQFWANLPASRKMMPPRYREVKAAEIPVAALPGGASAKVIAGELAGVRGPVRDIVTDPRMLDVSVPGGGTVTLPVADGHTAFAYVLSGEGHFDERRDAYAFEAVGDGWSDLERGCACGPETVMLFEHAGDAVRADATAGGVRFLFVSGRPLGEPVAWYGPIVMNTKEELRVAFEEYANGTFVK
jgi:redox-sensitive bicupin YhaK (pirin superfamily)